MPHHTYPPFACTHGPRDAKVVLVGEAWGEQEEKGLRPFLGYSGLELIFLLAQSGLAPPIPPEWHSLRFVDSGRILQYWRSAGLLATNVLAMRPPENKLERVCVKKEELPEGYLLSPLGQGKYLHPELVPEVTRLRQELAAHPRNLIITLGATATWALLGKSAITSVRGTIHQSPWGKVLPTYHPAHILRQWSFRPVLLADLIKAQREAQFPEIRRPPRTILIDPTLEEVWEWTERLRNAPLLSIDTETSNLQITTIGFTASTGDAIVVPVLDKRRPDYHYWPTLEVEQQVWRRLKWFLEGPAPKLFQNGLYDVQYFFRHGIRVRVDEDLMLLHHSIWPEMPKSLGFIASVQVDEAAWKLMRKDKEEFKRDE